VTDGHSNGSDLLSRVDGFRGSAGVDRLLLMSLHEEATMKLTIARAREYLLSAAKLLADESVPAREVDLAIEDVRQAYRTLLRISDARHTDEADDDEPVDARALCESRPLRLVEVQA
jgi:hypothetical protein